MNVCLNPCSEIELSRSEPVMPWVQVQLMLQFKMIKPEEAAEALRILEEQYQEEDEDNGGVA